MANKRPYDEHFFEVITDYTDDENLTHIGGYESEDENSSGRTIAVVDRDSLKVIFFDNGFRNQKQIAQAIDEVIRDIQDERALVAFKATANTLLDSFKAFDKAWDVFNPNYEFQPDVYPFGNEPFYVILEKVESMVAEINAIK